MNFVEFKEIPERFSNQFRRPMITRPSDKRLRRRYQRREKLTWLQMQKDKRALMKNIISAVEEKGLTDQEKIRQKFSEPPKGEGSDAEDRI